MITVAARDLPGGTEILDVCSKYMHQLVAELSAGKRCDVEAVEALLLLAEWEPQSALSNVREVGCGEEDLAAWMHVGLALRIGYYLRLDRTSFQNDDEERMLHYNRRRLAWAGKDFPQNKQECPTKNMLMQHVTFQTDKFPSE
jgi:hypothetical protein